MESGGQPVTRLLGVTGGIGAGKSAACHILAQLGATIFEADAVAKHLMEHDSTIREEIIGTFGPESYTPSLNRPWLAKQVFGNDAALAALNAIVHPRVGEAFKKEKIVAESSRVPLLVHAAALLYEAGSHKKLDRIAVVYAPVSVRINRVTARDNVTEEAVRARMRHQIDPEEAIRMAEYVIDNSGTLADLRTQVKKLYNTVTVD